MNGETSQKTSSGLFHLSLTNTLIRYLLLFLMGSVAMLIHARLRMGLGIPGHQGFLYMALLTATSLALNTRLAALTFAAGSSALIATGWLGFHNPFMMIEYAFVGVVADLLLNGAGEKKYRLVRVLLIGALGYGMIPLVRMAVTDLTGYPFGSFVRYGFPLTMVSHFLFGMAGALAGYGFFSRWPAKK